MPSLEYEYLKSILTIRIITFSAWTDPQDEHLPDKRHGLLADSPAAFAQAGSVIPWENVQEEAPFEMTNRGLGITLPLLPLEGGLSVAALECHQSYQDNRYLGIYLTKVGTGPNQYARVNCHKLGTGLLSHNTRARTQRLFVRQAQTDEREYQRTQYFQLRRIAFALEKYTVLDMIYPASADAGAGGLPNETSQARTWVPPNFPAVLPIPKGSRKLAVAILLVRPSDNEAVVVMMGSITDLQVGLCVCEAETWNQGYGALQAVFATGLTQFTEPWKLDCHHVHPEVKPHVQQGRKIYTVDLGIMAIPKRNVKNQAVEQLLETLESAPVQRFGKMHALFRRTKD